MCSEAVVDGSVNKRLWWGKINHILMQQEALGKSNIGLGALISTCLTYY